MAKQLLKDMKRTGILFYNVILLLTALFFVMGKGAGQIYLDMFLILLLMTFGTYFFARIQGGNEKVVIYTSVLLTIGTMLQCIFLQEAAARNPEQYVNTNPASGLQIQYLAAFVLAVLSAYLYKKGKFLARPKVIKGMFVFQTGIYLATLLLAKAVGNVRNWLVIGGFSVQTSEINKLIYILLMAGILGGVEKPSGKRIGFAFFVTFTNVFFLVLQSEFGTLLLLLFVFPVFLFLFVPDIRVTIKTVIGYAGMGVLFTGFGSFLTKTAAKSVEFGSLSIVQFLLRNYNKIANRFIYWLEPEKDPTGLGFQLLKAKEAIVLGGWFGTDAVTNLPVKTSDMVFPALIQGCGIILAILVLIVIIMLWMEGIRIFIRIKDRYHCAVCAGIVFMLFYQALIIVAGSCGLCPLTGITLPFISSGGSSLVVSAVMIGMIITISGKLEWEGEMDHEEMELEFKFLKKNPDCAKRLTAFSDRYRSFLNKNLSGLTGRFKRGGSGESESTVCPEPQGVCEGTDCRQEWGNTGEL